MNRLAITDRVSILRGLTEGCSHRSISRMVGVSINTVTKLVFFDAGRVCAQVTNMNVDAEHFNQGELGNGVDAHADHARDRAMGAFVRSGREGLKHGR